MHAMEPVPAENLRHATRSARGRRELAWLLPIVIAAAALRIIGLDQPAPGINQDEAANAWNAYCLLKTGRDQVGRPWPIFYVRALGENRVTPQIYAVLPFQAAGGMNVWTTRLPIALSGVLTVLLIYALGNRLLGPPGGLFAAALLALNPWHIQLTRLCFGASLTPLLLVLALTAMCWARLPVCDDRHAASPPRAAVAGILAGLACYGYFALRLFFPLFLAAIVLVGWPRWRDLCRTRNGAIAVAAFAAALLAMLAPLGWQHVAHADEMLRRGTDEPILLWQRDDSPTVVAVAMAIRYAAHFGPEFLFINGDQQLALSVPGVGSFHWYALPLLVIGLIQLVRRAPRSTAARILLAWVVLYPIGDIFAAAVGTHSLRSAPGLCGLILVAAAGATTLFEWLRRLQRPAALAAGGAVLLACLLLNARFWHRYFREYARHPEVYHTFQADLMEACAWLRPRLGDYDAVFFTVVGLNQPYVNTLVGLRYPPAQWFNDTKEIGSDGPWDVYHRYGRIHFMYEGPTERAVEALRSNDRPDRAAFVVRPDHPATTEPVHVIRRPDGIATLLIYEMDL